MPDEVRQIGAQVTGLLIAEGLADLDRGADQIRSGRVVLVHRGPADIGRRSDLGVGDGVGPVGLQQFACRVENRHAGALGTRVEHGTGIGAGFGGRHVGKSVSWMSVGRRMSDGGRNRRTRSACGT